MTDEEIFELAKSCGIDKQEYGNGNCWECWDDQLLNFSRKIYQQGVDRGSYDTALFYDFTDDLF